MLQILVLSALVLMISQTDALNATIGYTFFNIIMFLCMGIQILSFEIWPMILMKSVLVYVFFRILQDYEGSGLKWWGIYFVGMPLIFLSDRFLGLPLIMAYSNIPFVDSWESIGKPAYFSYSLPHLIRALFAAKKEVTGV